MQHAKCYKHYINKQALDIPVLVYYQRIVCVKNLLTATSYLHSPEPHARNIPLRGCKW